MPGTIEFDVVKSVAAVKISKSSKMMLYGLGASVLSAMLGAVTLAIKQVSQQLIDAGIAALEKNALVLQTRQTLQAIKVVMDQYNEFHKQLDQVVKCLELIPELHTPVVSALSTVTDVVSTVRSYADKLERLTYMSDLANALVEKLQQSLYNLLSVQKLLQEVLEELPTIPAIDIAIALATILSTPCSICPPLDPWIQRGRDELQKRAKEFGLP